MTGPDINICIDKRLRDMIVSKCMHLCSIVNTRFKSERSHNIVNWWCGCSAITKPTVEILYFVWLMLIYDMLLFVYSNIDMYLLSLQYLVTSQAKSSLIAGKKKRRVFFALT